MKNNNISLIRAIVVDYYGTLVDVGNPFDNIKQWIKKTYEELSVDENSIYMAFLKEHVKLQNNGKFCLGQDILMRSYKKACNKYDLPFYRDKFYELILHLFTYPPSFPNVKHTVAKLREYYQVLLLTNADNHILYKSIQLQGFEFDFILTSEDLQCDKPDKRIFKKACEMLNVLPEYVLMIGDSLSDDIYGALSYGMQAIWINKENRQCDPSISQISSIGEIESIMHLER